MQSTELPDGTLRLRHRVTATPHETLREAVRRGIAEMLAGLPSNTRAETIRIKYESDSEGNRDRSSSRRVFLTLYAQP